MKLKWLPVVIAVALSLGTLPVWAERPTHDGKVVLFGNLHAHSQLSDDIDAASDDLSPIRAFTYADEHGIDFLAITDHHKATDSPHRLFMTPDEYKTHLFDVAKQYNADHAGEFIAIPGIEWGNTATGNHVNLLGARELPPNAIHDADYDKLYEWAREHCDFVQFNHPNSWKGESQRNTNVGNFGENLYVSPGAFVEAVQPTVRTISILTSVYKGHISGPLRHSEDKTHREMQWESYYKAFLNKGCRLSPSANQDTHWRNWGTVTAARTAAWADRAAYGDLINAFRANRVYATEDDEMAVVLQLKYRGRMYWMGDTVPLESDEEDVLVLVRVWQSHGSDGDPVDEGPYTVTIVRDSDGVGGQEASALEPVHGVPSGSLREVPLRVRPGEYLYLEVTEEQGKDNASGDGEDVVNNETGEDQPDGKRDDLNDSAWTSPIWFGTGEPTPVVFVWSVHSSVYHDPTCWAVSRIGAANRRSGADPGSRTKHSCHP